MGEGKKEQEMLQVKIDQGIRDEEKMELEEIFHDCSDGFLTDDGEPELSIMSEHNTIISHHCQKTRELTTTEPPETIQDINFSMNNDAERPSTRQEIIQGAKKTQVEIQSTRN